jgi:hypothetical protein
MAYGLIVEWLREQPGVDVAAVLGAWESRRERLEELGDFLVRTGALDTQGPRWIGLPPEPEDPGAMHQTRPITPPSSRAFRRPTPVPSLGETLGRCRLESRLGIGGSAVVFRARHLGLDVPVAVKVLTTPDGPQLGATEARLLARLDHPHIVRVLDVDAEGSIPHLVLELVDGPPLYDILRQRGALPPAEAARIALEVAQALDHAAERGVLHRDLKPSNILLGRDGRSRVADLGIAAPNGAIDDSTEVLGTLTYLAPERLRPGPNRNDPRADLWSLGIVLHEMLVGRPPWRPTTPRALLEVNPSKLVAPPTVDPGLWAVVTSLLQLDPDARPSSPAQVVTALRPFAGAPAVYAPVQTWAGAEAGATLQGALERSDVGTLVRVLHASRKTGQLVIHHPGGEARVDLQDGEVVGIRAPGRDAETAFQALARVQSGTFAFHEGRRPEGEASGRVDVTTDRLLKAIA